MRHLRSVAACAAVGLVITLASCSNGSDGNASKKADAKAAAAFTKVRQDACSLLTEADIAKVVADSKPKAVADPPLGGCRYQLADERTLDVDLYRPLTASSLRDRQAGTANVNGGNLLLLNTPGSGVLVHKGNTGALVAIRATDSKDAQEIKTDVEALAKVVASRLPDAPAAGNGLTDRDLCDVVPLKTFGAIYAAGDGRDPDACAYRGKDGTLISIQLRSGTTAPGALGKPWKPGGKGATWQPSGAKEGGSGLALIPVDGGTIEVAMSSPKLSDAQLEKLAGKVASIVRDIDQN